MPKVPKLTTDANRKALRELYFLYGVYTDVTFDHMEKPRSTSIELNALYRNNLVPQINKIVTDLNIGPSSTRRWKLLFEPTPFRDLTSIAYEVRESGEDINFFIANLGKMQSMTKDLIESNGATEIYGSLDDAQETIADINRLRSSQDSSGSLVRLGEKPHLERSVNFWYVIGTNGRKKLSKKGSITGELLEVLLKNWGAARSYEAIFVDVNKHTSKQNWDKECIPNAMKQINKVVHKAGYRRLKLIDNGLTGTIGFTEKAQQ